MFENIENNIDSYIFWIQILLNIFTVEYFISCVMDIYQIKRTISQAICMDFGRRLIEYSNYT